MIPPELSDVAADMLSGIDDLETARTALHAERATLHVALGSMIRVRKVLTWSVALHVFGFVAWLSATVAVLFHV